MKRYLTKITAITSIALFVACTQDEEVLTNVEAAKYNKKIYHNNY